MNQELKEKLQKIETSLAKALPDNFDLIWKENSFGKLPAAISDSYIKNLIEPNLALLNLGGKRWRPLLLILCYENFLNENSNHLSEEQVYSLTPLIEFVHTASLIHDDIEDSADLRRGKPAAHITYGLDTALNCASWLYFEATVCINNLQASLEQKNQLYMAYTQELRKLHLGQAMDIFWHRNPECFPDKDEYMAMVQNKTGTLSSLATKIGCLAGGLSPEKTEIYGETAAKIGIGFQIIDDVINLTTGNPGKKRGDDIVEGKKSLPVLLHIEQYPEEKHVISALMTQAAREGINSPAVEECIAILNKSSCITDAAKMGTDFIRNNCNKFNSALISELFNSMIPEQFR